MPHSKRFRGTGAPFSTPKDCIAAVFIDPFLQVGENGVFELEKWTQLSGGAGNEWRQRVLTARWAPPTTSIKFWHSKVASWRFSKMEYARSPEAAPVKRGTTRCFRTSNRSRLSFNAFSDVFHKINETLFSSWCFWKVGERAGPSACETNGGPQRWWRTTERGVLVRGRTFRHATVQKHCNFCFDQKVLIVAVCEFCKWRVLTLLGRNQGRHSTSWVQLQPFWQQRSLSNLYRGKFVFTPRRSGLWLTRNQFNPGMHRGRLQGRSEDPNRTKSHCYGCFCEPKTSMDSTLNCKRWMARKPQFWPVFTGIRFVDRNGDFGSPTDDLGAVHRRDSEIFCVFDPFRVQSKAFWQRIQTRAQEVYLKRQFWLCLSSEIFLLQEFTLQTLRSKTSSKSRRCAPIMYKLLWPPNQLFTVGKSTKWHFASDEKWKK